MCTHAHACGWYARTHAYTHAHTPPPLSTAMLHHIKTAVSYFKNTERFHFVNTRCTHIYISGNTVSFSVLIPFPVPMLYSSLLTLLIKLSIYHISVQDCCCTMKFLVSSSPPWVHCCIASLYDVVFVVFQLLQLLFQFADVVGWLNHNGYLTANCIQSVLNLME